MGVFYRRRLPHWQPDGQIFFVTFRLYGSLPRDSIEQLRAERKRLQQQPSPSNETARDRALRESKRLFALADQALAREAANPKAKTPKWLSDSRVASIVREAIHHRSGKVYELHRYVIMPNHVHLVIEPLPLENADDDATQWTLAAILGSLKRHTARQANRILGRAGAFWQDESYDHWVRDPAEYGRIVEYIDRNPVEAGLCASPQVWPWSAAGETGQVANLPHNKWPIG